MLKNYLIWTVVIGSSYIPTTITNDIPIKVGVFCSADNKIQNTYKEMAYNLGCALGSAQLELIIGGSNTGLMKEVTDGYLVHGKADLISGILPKALQSFNVLHADIPSLNVIWAEDIHQRLKIFYDACDIILILPGGFGTLHELMDFVVHNQFGTQKKPIILLNFQNFWDGLLEQFETMISMGALSPKHFHMITVVRSLQDCLEELCMQGSIKQDHNNLEERYWESPTER